MRFRTLCELLDDSARSWPDKVAIGTADHELELSYSQLEALTGELAAQLRRLGVGECDTIAVLSDNCVELAPALFAVTCTGAVAALVDPALTQPEIASRLSSIGAKATLVPEHLYDHFAEASAHSSAVWKLRLQGTPRRLQATIVAPNATTMGAPPVAGARRPSESDVALMMFTAGTTSAAKVVPLTHANLDASIAGICTTYRLSPDDATLLVMPMFHGHGLVAGLLATLASGGAAYIPRARRFSARSFWREMVDVRATWYTAVPTIHQILLARAPDEYPKDHPPNLRFIRSSSASLAATVLEDIEATFCAPVIPAYGMTETAHQATSNPLPTAGRRKASSVGLATGVEIQVVGPDGHAVEADTVGEVCVRGPALTSGYLHDPAANAASFVGGWFHTGDLGYLDGDGYLFLQGRSKDIINRGGEKISPHAVDAVLSSNPKVEEALSFGVPDPKYGEEISAAIILKPGQSASEQELEQYSLTKLSAFEVPKRFYFVADFPRTAKGAGDRRKLAAMFGDSSRRKP
jgi:acyl-CoA synthetase (AMP-forming)/AMP-acid ligase II